MANTWEHAWEEKKYDVGRAMHEGWKRQKIANGFADHPFVAGPSRFCEYGSCDGPRDRHHPDMIDWDELPLEQQAINYEGGREGFRMGFEAGQESR